ncbi:Hsp20/alpha crystallin family protein [Haloarculaceae archaeon H-GB2-1]|nr:Hsp20/alpha crystallin family protein [Haloarculaceae archaeon H-GB1-1]MEA5388878.1 Hsp20/alpha crystallin family protein [Haloarculaceae archaeon H-GB11]MEA5406930.1 Hsp20/alpha crystallin family protein [Haloarculaceae archaeon H-GB2-1]
MAKDTFDELERVLELMGGQFGGDFDALPVDVADEGDTFAVVADLPGFVRDDIDVKLTDDTTLFLSAEHSEEHERVEPRRWVQRERQERAISRTITLPDRVEEEGSTANFDNGVLTVRLPKKSVDPDTGTDIPVN